MHRAILSIVVATFSLPLQLEGAVFERDFIVPGDGLLTYDNVNQREWLDLTETAGVDLATVLEWMTPGGKLEGFSFALFEDVEALAISAGVEWMEPWMIGNPGGESAELAMLLGPVMHARGGLLGDAMASFGQVASKVTGRVPTFDDTNLYVVCLGCQTEALEGEIQPGGTMNRILLPRNSGGIFTSGPYSLESLGGPTYGIGDIGPFWLYRVAVPEPSSMVLLAIGTLGTCWRRRIFLV